VAEKIKKDIETKNERYIAYKPAPTKKAVRRTGANSFVDLIGLYNQQFN
jgi:hypothetical protein